MYISFIDSIRSSLTCTHGFHSLLQLPYFIEITFFVFTNRVNLLNLKQSSERLVIIAKGFLKLPNLLTLTQQKNLPLSRNLAFGDFWRISKSVLNKGKFTIPPVFNDPELLSSASDKAKLFPENSSKNSNLDDSGISLPVFLSRTNLKLRNISRSPKMVKKVIMNLDLSKASGPDCIPVVVLKNCEPEISYILAEFFHECLKESRFLDCWKASSVVPIFKNIGERSTAKTTVLLSSFYG